MAKRHKLQLTDEQTQTLRQLRDTAEPAYLRERAGALLKIAAGMSPHKVAQSLHDDETCYGMGALNAHTGDLVYQQTESATVVVTHVLYSEICQRYPKAERIYVIQDNRPVHLHPNLLAALLPQTSSFQKPLPPSWIGKFSQKIGKLAKLPIEVLQLPTYASWTNPIEKLW